MPLASEVNLDLFLPFINAVFSEFQINTPIRQATFLAQIAHESGCLRYTKEIGEGHSYDVGQSAKNLGNTPEDDGDGERLKGRGLIQITGTTNYRDLGTYFKMDFLAKPELLETPEWATRSAGWFWNKKKLNSYADMPDTWRKIWNGQEYDRFRWITLLINGGQNGLADRLKYYELAKKALGI